MIPIRDENPSLHTSFATFAIIGLNLISWIWLQGLGMNPKLAQSICQFGLIPGEFLGSLKPGTAINLGNGVGCIIQDQANLLTPLTSMFMHGGWLHLLFNMWFLALFGDNVEDAMGFFRFIIFYLLCGFGAVALQLFSSPGGSLPMIGASGAIGGVMGAYALLYPKAPVHMLVFLGFFFFRIVVPAYFMLGYWFLLQLISALSSFGDTRGGVAFAAHVGGFLTGVVLVKFFCSTERLAACRSRRGKMSRFVQRIR
ncbi:MAG: rhomboid family intramembrane serine protease [Desulfurivibrio sp.]|jgi:membrane associated rhomboid family serine protease|nr:MAG: rhomboid family intramembrane serine protease [Desulfurivibrio sp.]